MSNQGLSETRSRFRITKNQRRMQRGSATIYNICLAASGNIVVSVRNLQVAEFVAHSLEELHQRTETAVSAAEGRRAHKAEQRQQAAADEYKAKIRATVEGVHETSL